MWDVLLQNHNTTERNKQCGTVDPGTTSSTRSFDTDSPPQRGSGNSDERGAFDKYGDADIDRRIGSRSCREAGHLGAKADGLSTLATAISRLRGGAADGVTTQKDKEEVDYDL